MMNKRTFLLTCFEDILKQYEWFGFRSQDSGPHWKELADKRKVQHMARVLIETGLEDQVDKLWAKYRPPFNMYLIFPYDKKDIQPVINEVISPSKIQPPPAPPPKEWTIDSLKTIIQ